MSTNEIILSFIVFALVIGFTGTLYCIMYYAILHKKLQENRIDKYLRLLNIYSIILLTAGVILLGLLYFLSNDGSNTRPSLISYLVGIVATAISVYNNVFMDRQIMKLARSIYKESILSNYSTYSVLKGILLGIMFTFIIARVLQFY